VSQDQQLAAPVERNRAHVRRGVDRPAGSSGSLTSCSQPMLTGFFEIQGGRVPGPHVKLLGCSST
jgi:hypothetical protein